MGGRRDDRATDRSNPTDPCGWSPAGRHVLARRRRRIAFSVREEHRGQSHGTGPNSRTLAHRNGSRRRSRQRPPQALDQQPDQQRLHLDRGNGPRDHPHRSQSPVSRVCASQVASAPDRRVCPMGQSRASRREMDRRRAAVADLGRCALARRPAGLVRAGSGRLVAVRTDEPEKALLERGGGLVGIHPASADFFARGVAKSDGGGNEPAG